MLTGCPQIRISTHMYNTTTRHKIVRQARNSQKGALHNDFRDNFCSAPLTLTPRATYIDPLHI